MNWWFEVVWGFPPTEAFLHFLEAQGEKPHTDTAAPKWVACLISGGGWNPGNLILDIKPYSNLPVSMGFWTTPPRVQILKGWWKRRWKKTMGICSSRNSCRFENPHFYGSSNPKGPIFLGIELHATWLQLPAPCWGGFVTQWAYGSRDLSHLGGDECHGPIPRSLEMPKRNANRITVCYINFSDFSRILNRNMNRKSGWTYSMMRSVI